MGWFIEWIETLIMGVQDAYNWLITPFWNGLTPLVLLSVSGLLIFVSVAVVNWVVK